jgi:predicted DsbA family dithiol-disulfide isomerase
VPRCKEPRLERKWAPVRGGYEGFADHVGNAASKYDDAQIHPNVWKSVRPATSANAHLVLKAVALAESTQAMVEFEGHLRRAFFTEAVDIGKRESLLQLASDMSLSRDAIADVLESGRAMAALMSDYGRAEQQGIRGSPSWVMNEGRQILYGNVGYRILNANIEELLKHPEDEASWCS